MEEEFEKNGYIILKNIFSIKEINNYKNIILNYINKNKTFKSSGGISIPDFIKIKEFQDISNIRNNKNINVYLNKIFKGNNYRFCKHNDIGINRIVGWHKDKLNGFYSKYEIHDIWKPFIDQKHEIVKVLIYLQDHSKNNDGLKIVPASHLKNDYNYKNFIQLKPEIGDVIIFDQRITHRGMEKQVRDPRILISFGFGKNNIFTDNFEKGTVLRQQNQTSKL